jgi:hypothetical protein
MKSIGQIRSSEARGRVEFTEKSREIFAAEQPIA